MKRNVFVMIASVCLLFVSCNKEKTEEGGIDCVSFQKKANTIEDMVVGQYNSVQSVFYHVGGWEWSCCFNTISGLKEGDSLKVCGYAVKKIPNSHNSDYYIVPGSNTNEMNEKIHFELLPKSLLYKLCDNSQETSPYVIVGIDTTNIRPDFMNAFVGKKDNKLFLKGNCYLLYVGDTLFNDKEISPGYNMTNARFDIPFILVSDSNDIVIRKGE